MLQARDETPDSPDKCLLRFKCQYSLSLFPSEARQGSHVGDEEWGAESNPIFPHNPYGAFLDRRGGEQVIET
jgi:hypothetical protein